MLREVLSRWRRLSYADLVARVGQTETTEESGASGCRYQVEIQVFWDDRPEENIRVTGAIDDGGWRAFAPLSDGFILGPQGVFVGE